MCYNKRKKEHRKENASMNHENDIMLQAITMKDELVASRRWLHAHPELGFEETGTSAYIKEYLEQLGLDVRTGIAGTGVAALLRGNLPGNTVLLRADMDALPITEEGISDFKSIHEGKMHACGHDSHMAMLLGAADILSKNRDRLCGTVKFVFQPAEEGVKGARKMIDEGILHDPDVDLALALHIVPDVDAGRIAVKSGAVTACADEFQLKVIGKGGHSSSPQTTVDPIVTGAQLVMAYQTIVSRKISPLEPAVVSVCQFLAGTTSNVIPETAQIGGKTRCYSTSVQNTIIEQLETITKGICGAAGAEYELTIERQVPVTMNDRNVFDDFIRCASDILDVGEIQIMTVPQTFSEDFSLIAQKVPSLLFFLGTGNAKKNCIFPLHSPKFQVDEDVLPLGSAIFANFCLNRQN